MRFGWSARRTSVRLQSVAKIAAVLFIAIYIVIYETEPFAELWDHILINSFPAIVATCAAVLATMIRAGYEPAEAPRRIWTFFAIGLWLWVLAELSWAVLDVIWGEVPVGLPDVFWVAAYLFFAAALLIQYRLLAHPTKQELWSRMAAAALVLLALYLLAYRLLGGWVDGADRWDAVVNAFYPVGDLFLAVIAVWLVRHFSGGAFARPWLGLFAFTFTDLLYAWVEVSDLYPWSANLTEVLADMFDIAYVGAYLVLGLGLLSQWMFLKYGLRAPTQPQ